MSGIMDRFTPIRSLIHWLDGERRTSPERPTVRLQLEQLEKREVLNCDPALASAATVSYQMLENVFTTVVHELPTISRALNYVPPQYQQFAIRTVDSLLFGLESLTHTALWASMSCSTAVPQDPIFNANVQAINYFMANPLNDPYAYPPGIFGS